MYWETKQDYENEVWRFSKLYPASQAASRPAYLPASMEPSGALSQARLLQGTVSKGGLGSLPTAFRKPAASLYDLNKTKTV